jgi:hypothetical protein
VTFSGPTSLGETPRRLGLTLPELQLTSRTAGDLPLPFELASPTAEPSIASRLGATGITARDSSYRSALAGLPDAGESLTQRGLLDGDRLDDGLAGALRLLAAPEVAVALDLRMGEVRAKVWHRLRGDAVAMLSTIDGVAFELAWCHTDGWAAELARVTAPSTEWEPAESAVPARLVLPRELLEGAAEAIATGRPDLVEVLAAWHSGAVRGVGDEILSDAAVIEVLTALSREAQGRLRCVVGRVPTSPATPDRAVIGGEQKVTGVVSRTLLADGWRSLHLHGGESPRVELLATDPVSLHDDLVPLLAEAAR